MLFNTKRAPGGTQTASTERQTDAGANKLLIRRQRLWSRCRASHIFVCKSAAELGAAFLCADIGITPEIRDDHAAYLGHWLKVLREDKRAIFSAAAHAQRAADSLNGMQPQQEEECAAA